ncbi:MAG TPA: M13 family metallopeptidase [Puia sp.]|nr:M13 family metallopeptidase [Puia sp.]
MRKIFILAGLISVVLIGCKLMDKNNKKYIETAGMDLTEKPGNDFFEYANGAWMKRTRIPADQSGTGTAFILIEENKKKINNLLIDLASGNYAAGTIEQKAGDFYASGMDTDAIEKKGWDPIRPGLAKIDSIQDYKSLLKLVAAGFASGDGDLLGFDVHADAKNSSRNIAILYQTGLTLPDKDYYSRSDSMTVEQRHKLQQYATTLFRFTESDSVTAAKKAADVLQLETAVAASHRTPVELRDPKMNYNKMSVPDLEKLSPEIPWMEIFQVMGIHPDSIDVEQPGYYKALGSLLASQPIAAWKAKVEFDFIAGKAERLSSQFQKAAFEFGKIFSGLKVQPPRWKSIVQATDDNLQDVLGQLFAEKYFPEDAKQRMDGLVDNLITAFSARIDKLDWMSDTTKQKAHEKLAAVIKKIGYPSKWKSFADVDITPTDYFGNLEKLDHHFYEEQIRKMGKAVDRTEWEMTVPTVNAYYADANNEIVFPAGILQPPFFDRDADDAVVYGGIGAIIGHEMTHGFDDQGRQYDANGNLRDWWTKTDEEKFNARAARIVRQYSQYVAVDTLHVNGQLTLGENIADLGGLSIAYDAFKMTEQGKGSEKIAGLTPDQRFFLAFAQLWRMKRRPETMRMLVNIDPHSPDRFRVNGVVFDQAPFYGAFDITDKYKMYRSPADRVLIW